MRSVFICTLTLFLIAACSPGSTSSDPLPLGDASRGATLFTESLGGSPACSTCHTLDGTSGVGPGLEGYAAHAANRVEGVSAEAYTHTSIIQPGAYVVEGFSNVMFPQYGQRLTAQQTADLIAYLLTL